MHLTLSTQHATDVRAELLVIATTRARRARDLTAFAPPLKRLLRETVARAEFTGTDGSTLFFQTHRALTPHAIVLVGTDPAAAPRTWLQLGTIAVEQARQHKARSVAISFGTGLEKPDAIGTTAEGALLSAYRFDRFKSRPAKDPGPTRIEMLITRTDASTRGALQRAELFAAATNYTRDLIMTPAAEITPVRLAQEASQLARRHHLRVRIFNERALKRMGMGAILGVAQGSAQPPRLIELIYRPRARAKKRVAIVGKGITFDSGGLSLKNPDAMQGQKRDMAGGAVVLGVMSVIAQLAPAIEVRGYVASAENMPDGRAIRPGDVLRAFNGKTIEVLNTDAEGRLVLADALAYAAKAKPDLMIDLATLTAAVGAALGRRCAGIMSTDATLAEALIHAGRREGENLWELPLIDDYRADINSRVADIKNTGEGSAGTIIGGLFLREFVANVPWAHIDFSSTVITDKALPAHPIGATGFGVRTLLQYITSL